MLLMRRLIVGLQSRRPLDTLQKMHPRRVYLMDMLVLIVMARFQSRRFVDFSGKHLVTSLHLLLQILMTLLLRGTLIPI